MVDSNGGISVKKIYMILLSVFGIEIFIISMLNERNVKFESWIANAVGTLMVLLPIQILLFLLERDEHITPKRRLVLKIVFWFITICYILGGVATLMTR